MILYDKLSMIKLNGFTFEDFINFKKNKVHEIKSSPQTNTIITNYFFLLLSTSYILRMIIHGILTL